MFSRSHDIMTCDLCNLSSYLPVFVGFKRRLPVIVMSTLWFFFNLCNFVSSCKTRQNTSLSMIQLFFIKFALEPQRQLDEKLVKSHHTNFGRRGTHRHISESHITEHYNATLSNRYSNLKEFFRRLSIIKISSQADRTLSWPVDILHCVSAQD